MGKFFVYIKISSIFDKYNKSNNHVMMFYDIEDIELKNGDIISLCDDQTVNGCNVFVVFNTNPDNLDIRYGFDLAYKYQYSKIDLLTPDKINGNSPFKIIGNVL